MPDFIRCKITKAVKPTECPVCLTLVDRVRYTYGEEGSQSKFYHCEGCGFILCRPVLIEELNQRQMDGVDVGEMYNSELLKKLYSKLIVRKEVRLLKKFSGEDAPSAIDIGCGTGWTTRLFADNGFEMTGLEPSTARAQFAREKYGLTILEEYIENVEIEKGYVLAVLRQVLEHFEDPVSVIQSVKRLLRPGGLVLVVVPNINSLGRYIFDTDWSWILPWHCNFFTPKSLRLYLEKNGFQVLKCYQTPSPIFFPEAFERKFPGSLTRKLISEKRAPAMLACAPFSVLGTMLGLGDNLTCIARMNST